MTVNGTLPGQLRAARALLGWTQRRLAKEAGLSVATVNRVEASPADARVDALEAILNALAARGIEFIGDADGSTGVVRRPGAGQRRRTPGEAGHRVR